MQPATLKQRMFRTAFDCDRAERAALIDFMKFLSDNDVQDTLPNHPLGPSSAWMWWGSESFIGFGPSRVLLQTGHRFAISEPTKRHSRKPWACRRLESVQDGEGIPQALSFLRRSRSAPAAARASSRSSIFAP